MVEGLGLDFEGLLSQWVEAGYPPSDFWRQTPRRLFVILKAVASSIEARRDELIWHAYHVACLSKADPMPSLESLLHNPASKAATMQAADSPDEVRRRIRGWLGRVD